MSQQNRQELYAFIASTFTDYDFDRAVSSSRFFSGFDSYETFLQYQQTVIDSLNLEQLTAYYTLMLLIRGDSLDQMDKESMIPFESSGFCFIYRNGGTRCVTFHER